MAPMTQKKPDNKIKIGASAASSQVPSDSMKVFLLRVNAAAARACVMLQKGQLIGPLFVTALSKLSSE